jgi:hypothetical protein
VGERATKEHRSSSQAVEHKSVVVCGCPPKGHSLLLHASRVFLRVRLGYSCSHILCCATARTCLVLATLSHFAAHVSHCAPARSLAHSYWTNGGPGGSGINNGLLVEMGLVHLDETSNTSLIINPYAWSKVVNLSALHSSPNTRTRMQRLAPRTCTAHVSFVC